MATRGDTKRERLRDAAVELVHRQGFERTTLADLARETGVPLGSVYYYFKTKEAIGEAVVSARAAGYRARLVEWDELADPRRRIERFIGMIIENRDGLAQRGCPVGTLVSELRKNDAPLASSAAAIFEDVLVWLEQQFRQLGQGRRARGHAERVLAALEGATLLAHAFGDASYLDREAERLKEWLRELAPK
ncbi:TetR/AcrR family transcriptional regulator [Sorangium sp. So ce1036]|uniref:TetR/AcrR family transcriptional regulator n=1 Tax=Sorangium sp. So ce1036 TaxID=3133328 RepID=UPI003F049622